MMRKSPLWPAIALALLCSSPVLAQEKGVAEVDAGADIDAGADKSWAFHGGVTALSDYVWRGVSQTQENAALQGELIIEHRSGWYAGVWASTVDFTARGDEDDGISYELDPSLGWSGELGAGTELDVVLTRVTYPGAKAGYDSDYTELEGTLGFAEYYHVGLAYSPDIFNLGGKGLYYNAGAEWPLGDSGFTLQAQAGYYDLDDAAGDSYNDYLVAVSRDFGPVHAQLQYTDTSSYGPALYEALGDVALADGRVALTLGWAF